MPMYDYKCLDCGKESLVVLTLKEHESNKVKCPKCGSTKLQQLYRLFVATRPRKASSMLKKSASEKDRCLLYLVCLVFLVE